MKFTGERYLPSNISDEISIFHYQRYISVLGYCKDKRVLDIACGEGYGSNILSEVAAYIEGIDISEEVIQHAIRTYKKENLRYKVGSVDKIPANEDSFDVVISFETLEHVDEKMQFLFLKEVKRVLRYNGILIISSPDKKNYSDIPGVKNDYHVHELYKNEFKEFIGSFFEYTKLYDQTMYCISVINDGKNNWLKNSEQINLNLPEEEPRSEYSIAVCSNKKTQEYLKTLVIDKANIYYRMKDLISSLKIAVNHPEILEQKENYICEQRQMLLEKDKEIREINGIIERKENYIQEQREMIRERDKEIQEKECIIEQKENYICEQREMLLKKDKEIREINGIIEQKENYIQEQREMIRERDKEIQEKECIIEQKENCIQEQKEEILKIGQENIKVKKYICKIKKIIGMFPLNIIYRLLNNNREIKDES